MVTLADQALLNQIREAELCGQTLPRSCSITQPTWLWWGTGRLAQEQQRANRWAEQLKALGVEPQ